MSTLFTTHYQINGSWSLLRFSSFEAADELACDRNGYVEAPTGEIVADYRPKANDDPMYPEMTESHGEPVTGCCLSLPASAALWIVIIFLFGHLIYQLGE